MTRKNVRSYAIERNETNKNKTTIIVEISKRCALQNLGQNSTIPGNENVPRNSRLISSQETFTEVQTHIEESLETFPFPDRTFPGSIDPHTRLIN